MKPNNSVKRTRKTASLTLTVRPTQVTHNNEKKMSLTKRVHVLIPLTVLVLILISACVTMRDHQLRSLFEAPNVKELDRAYFVMRTTAADLAAVYQSRRLDLSPSQEEEIAFLHSLPTTEEQLSQVYSLTYDSLFSDDERVLNVVYGMFERSARLARKRGIEHQRFISLCLLADGELAENAWEWFDWLLLNDTERTIAAIRELPLEDQRRICRDADLGTMRPEEAREKCAIGR